MGYLAGSRSSVHAVRRWAPGRRLAQLLCIVFAVLGTLPIVGGILVKTSRVERWAARHTARWLQESVGVRARYAVAVSLWPPRLMVSDIVLPASDRGAPALTVGRIVAHPKLLALLEGRLDVGDVVVENPRARLVIRDGTVRNLSYSLPPSQGPSRPAEHAPFTTLSIENAAFDVDVEGFQLTTNHARLSVAARRGMIFEAEVKIGETKITQVRRDKAAEHPTDLAQSPSPKTIHDEDVLCRAEVSAEWDGRRAAVHRLVIEGRADRDPASGTRPGCKRAEGDDPTIVAVFGTHLSIDPSPRAAPVVRGHVAARAPVWIANRFASMAPLHGWAGVDVDVDYDGSTQLPALSGRVHGKGLGIEGYMIAQHLDARVEVGADQIKLPTFVMGYSDGVVTLMDTAIDVFAQGVPIRTRSGRARDVLFSSIMRDMDVTPNTVVSWHLTDTRLSNIGGTLDPPRIDGSLTASTRDFVVYDRSFSDPARERMIGVQAANLQGRFGVRPNALEFYDTVATFGTSRVETELLSIGFNNDVRLVVGDDTHIELGDIGPLAGIQMSGKAALSADMAGRSGNPELRGKLAVDDFVFGGFPVGDITSSEVGFRPLQIDITAARALKGQSPLYVPAARFDFDAGATLVVDATVRSERFDIRDFMAMWNMETDPRFEDIKGTTAAEAQVHYALGGPEDACGQGHLQVGGTLRVRQASLFGEGYGKGTADFELDWPDRDAGFLGFSLEVPSLVLAKGGGNIVGALSVRPGGELGGQLTAHHVPVSALDALGGLGPKLDGHGSAVIELGGRLDAMRANASVTVSPVRIGAGRLGSSNLSVRLTPTSRPLRSQGTTRCGRPIPEAFDPVAFANDPVDGIFHVDGELFGGQVRLADVQITQQRSRSVRGSVALDRLDLGALSHLSSALAMSDEPPSGMLSGRIDVDELNLGRPAEAKARAALAQFAVGYGGLHAELAEPTAALTLHDGSLELSGLALEVRTPGGQRVVIDARGSLSGPPGTISGDLVVGLRPADLSSLVGDIPGATTVEGTLEGGIHLHGSLLDPKYEGRLELRNGKLGFADFDLPISDAQMTLEVDEEQVRIARGQARLGTGTLKVSGEAPIRQLSLGPLRVVVEARGLALSPYPGVRANLDADLAATYRFGAPPDDREALPRVTGQVMVRSFDYTRPVTMAADLSDLAQRGRRTEFEAYDPSGDKVRFDVRLLPRGAMRIRNNLIEAELEIDAAGLQLTGTNQRFGLRGGLVAKTGGRILLRQHEFEIRRGMVRFDDETRILAEVDVTAVTEYRRYSDSYEDDQNGDPAATAASTTSSTGGRWTITLHAYGDADELKVDLTSEPPLAQDDIFLLLTVGLTRAELDQTQSASVSESMALEALGALSGADRAVVEALPVIDDFRFGSAYSSRTGRTEPTITVGKRLAERIRANVTSGLAESRELRSNVEWRLNQQVSLEGSYDNVNDISSSTLGNLGADIRWRLEFE